MTGHPLVSIVIVLYNSEQWLEPCLRSVAALDYRPLELLFVDNGSTDASIKVAREASSSVGLDASVLELGRNSGFAAANNSGVRKAQGEVVLLLNPDTEVYPDMLDPLVDALRSDDTGIAGCKVYYPDGRTLQHAGGYVRHNGLSMHYGVNEEDKGQYDEVRDVTYVTGAAIALRKDVFESSGGFDPGYFPAYFEETDLCLCMKRQGKKVLYIPASRITHHESTTTGRFTPRYYYLYHKNRIRFMLKNFPRSFLLNVALPTEQQWLDLIVAHEQAVPYNKAWLANMAGFPKTMAARRKARQFGPLPEGLTKDLLYTE